MPTLQLYIAASLDNYIARPDGSTDWLPTETGEDYGYDAFLEGVDTVVMGAKTYETILGFGIEWPYPQQKSYVFTRKTDRPADPNVRFISEDPCDFVRKLKAQPGKDIWLAGGGQINTLLLEAGLIDELILFIQPIVLGNGLPLFAGKVTDSSFEVKASKAYPSGMLQLNLLPKQ
jgi:dihydrofolate reductase